MCMIRLQRHIGAVARIGPASDWLVDVVVELSAEVVADKVLVVVLTMDSEMTKCLRRCNV